MSMVRGLEATRSRENSFSINEAQHATGAVSLTLSAQRMNRSANKEIA